MNIPRPPLIGTYSARVAAAGGPSRTASAHQNVNEGEHCVMRLVARRPRSTGAALALAVAVAGGVAALSVGPAPTTASAAETRASTPTKRTPSGAHVSRRVHDRRITEQSGLARSRRHGGVLWTHNDSGDSPRLFAVGWNGRTRAAYRIRGVSANDWEALAPGRDSRGRPVLYIGDIGDNAGRRGEIRVHRVTEPSRLRDGSLQATTFRLRYPDRAHDAEALLVHPHSQRLYVVTKKKRGATVYLAPRDLRTDRVNRLRRVADAPPWITDGTFLQDGRLVLRDYSRMYVSRGLGHRATAYNLPRMRQAESLAASFSGTGVYIGSEGRRQPILRIPVP